MTSATRTRPPSCPDENALVMLADGNLSERGRASIDQHLDGCAQCTGLLAELAGMARPELPVPARYAVIRQLAAGASGVVWEAEDAHLGRRVALKFVRAPDAGSRRRLSREARALARLRHRNVVTVLDVGDAGPAVFLALELVIGTDARAWRAARPRTTAEIVATWRQVAEGLAAAHRAGLLHRDVRPENVLVAEDGRVLLADFALAGDSRMRAGAAYEQLLGEPASRASDQYALCVATWDAITGAPPFGGSSPGAIAMAMRRQPRVPPGVRRADARFLDVLARGLDPNPAKRWPSVDVLAAALERAATLERRGARRTTASRRRYQIVRSGVLALGAAALAATATLGVLAWRARHGAPSHGAFVAPSDATPTEREVAIRPVVPPAAPAFHRSLAEVTPPPTTPAEATSMLARGRERLAAGDGRGCLEALGSAAPLPVAIAEQAGLLRATCTMRAGDCAAGRAMLEATARANAWDWSRLEMTLRTTDFANCPLAAEPRAMWGERARYRLMVAVSEQTSCTPVLAFIAEQGVTLPDERERYLLEASCRITDGDCAGARASFRRSYTFAERDPEVVAERTRSADAVFAKRFRQCQRR